MCKVYLFIFWLYWGIIDIKLYIFKVYNRWFDMHIVHLAFVSREVFEMKSIIFSAYSSSASVSLHQSHHLCTLLVLVPLLISFIILCLYPGSPFSFFSRPSTSQFPATLLLILQSHSETFTFLSETIIIMSFVFSFYCRLEANKYYLF